MVVSLGEVRRVVCMMFKRQARSKGEARVKAEGSRWLCGALTAHIFRPDVRESFIRPLTIPRCRKISPNLTLQNDA